MLTDAQIVTLFVEYAGVSAAQLAQYTETEFVTSDEPGEDFDVREWSTANKITLLLHLFKSKSKPS